MHMKMLTPEKPGNSGKELKGREEGHRQVPTLEEISSSSVLHNGTIVFVHQFGKNYPGTTLLKPNQKPNCALDLLPGHDLNQNPFASKKDSQIDCRGLCLNYVDD